MAASVSGSKTCTNDVAPHLTAATLTTILAIAPENMTVAQHNQLTSALQRISSGEDTTKTIGSLLI